MSEQTLHPSPPFKRMALIGLGLMGSSLAWAARRFELADEIVGYARSEQTRARALELGFIDQAHQTAHAAVEGADIVILCVPVGANAAIAEEISTFLLPNTIVTDVGSVKSAVIKDVGPHIPLGVHFIPAHPIAGTEQSGPDAGFADLFQGRWCVLTPTDNTDPTALKRLEEFWRGCGMFVDTMTPQHHDLVLAITSHVPHLIAYNIVGTAADLEEVTQSEVVKYAAGGFRDFTRIAASDPVMWRDVFLTNREAVLEMLGRFTEDLTALQRAIRWSDGKTLEELFTRTRAIRRGVIDAGQETDARDFGRWGKSEEDVS